MDEITRSEMLALSNKISDFIQDQYKFREEINKSLNQIELKINDLKNTINNSPTIADIENKVTSAISRQVINCSGSVKNVLSIEEEKKLDKANKKSELVKNIVTIVIAVATSLASLLTYTSLVLK